MKLLMLKRFLIAIALVSSIGAVARAQWPYVPIVQSKSTSANSASITCVFNNNVVSGNYGIMLMNWFNTTNTPTISDTLTSTYTLISIGHHLVRFARLKRLTVSERTLFWESAEIVWQAKREYRAELKMRRAQRAAITRASFAKAAA